jgi:hypothetical protein
MLFNPKPVTENMKKKQFNFFYRKSFFRIEILFPKTDFMALLTLCLISCGTNLNNVIIFVFRIIYATSFHFGVHSEKTVLLVWHKKLRESNTDIRYFKTGFGYFHISNFMF